MSDSSPLPRLDPTGARALGDDLRDAGYSVAAVTSRVGCASMYEFRGVRDGRDAGCTLDDRLDALIRLFCDAEAVDAATADTLLGSALVQRLASLDLVQRANGEYHPTVRLYPTESVLVASDLPAREGRPLNEDAVYPAITVNTRSFVSALPTTPCDRFLELCAGTGVAALITAPRAGRVWAADLTHRSTHFARFNALLNGVDNLTAVEGDLYEPVNGATFDRIAAHPPYRAEPERKFIFRDGGADGEQVTRGVIAGLPRYLAPSGVCYCTCVATDRKDAPLEVRLRGWLGETADQFDVLVAVQSSWTPTEWLNRSVSQGLETPENAEQRVRAFSELGIERQVYVTIVIRRFPSGRPPVTMRRTLGGPVDSAAIARFLRWDSELADRDRLDEVLAIRPRVGTDTKRHLVTERLAGGEWKAVAEHMVREGPFATRAECDGPVSTFLARCDGRHTIRDHWETMRRDGLLPPDLDPWHFASVVRTFGASGILDD